jgi:hypothetical protein
MFNQNKKTNPIKQAEKTTKERPLFKKNDKDRPKAEDDKKGKNAQSNWRSEGGKN